METKKQKDKTNSKHNGKEHNPGAGGYDMDMISSIMMPESIVMDQ